MRLEIRCASVRERVAFGPYDGAQHGIGVLARLDCKNEEYAHDIN